MFTEMLTRAFPDGDNFTGSSSDESRFDSLRCCRYDNPGRTTGSPHTRFHRPDWRIKMEIQISVTKKYIAIPVWTEPVEAVSYHLDIYDGSAKLYHWMLPDVKSDGTDREPDYYAFLPASLQEREKTGSGEMPAGQHILRIETDAPFFDGKYIYETDEPDYASKDSVECIHYHASYGSINDPNGMVYDGRLWHLYHQHNPMNNRWSNMTWGHAVSEDLVHFRFTGDVLFPDDEGVIFSGCGIVNDRECFGLDKNVLLFFYTYACERIENGTKNRYFTQRMAYSVDGGSTLVRYPGWELPTIEGENRDPKIFWHRESNAYIMVLYLTGNRFRILRSADLENWETTCEMNLPPMWECPDLLRFSDDLWAFVSADGYYLLGGFDGYKWTAESGMQTLYANDLPYAAQTFSGTDGRTIQVSWIRTVNKGENWHGMMTVPRELSLGTDENGPYIRQSFVKEALSYIKKNKEGAAVIEDRYIRESLDERGRILSVEQLF